MRIADSLHLFFCWNTPSNRRIVSLFLRACSLFLLFACASGCARTSTRTPAASAPKRIICGSPAVTEIVFALGCGDRVVGVSDYTAFPPEAQQKPRIGGSINPNRERLLAARPDSIVTQGRHDALSAFATTYGVRFLAIKLDTLADLYTSIHAISTLLGVPEQGRRLEAELRATLGTIAQRCSAMPPKRVLLLFGRTPGDLTGLNTVGANTFLNEIISLAGGTNIFADATGLYPHVSKEAILVRQPEVILELHPDGLSEAARTRLTADWVALAQTPAIQQAPLRYLTNDCLQIPGPRVGEIAQAFANAINPKAYRE